MGKSVRAKSEKKNRTVKRAMMDPWYTKQTAKLSAKLAEKAAEPSIYTAISEERAAVAEQMRTLSDCCALAALRHADSRASSHRARSTDDRHCGHHGSLESDRRGAS